MNSLANFINRESVGTTLEKIDGGPATTGQAARSGVPKRFGILSFQGAGHYYPLTALGRRLQQRGHSVVYFQIADLERPIRAAGLEFHPIGGKDYPLGTLRKLDETLSTLRGLAAFKYTVWRALRGSMMVMQDAPDAIREEGVDALIVDQIEFAGPSVAERLGLPFVSVAVALPLNLDSSVPPFCFPWKGGETWPARLRNSVGNLFFDRIMGWGLRRGLNPQRREWGLPPLGPLNTWHSPLAQIAQLPAALELPGRRLPHHFHHTGPWTDDEARARVDFPWWRLDSSRPYIYASMGTLQNGVLRAFRIIAQACAELDLQLVISLGGGQDPAVLGPLPGAPIVVGFAPQLELIRQSAMTISHGGLNTVLESLSHGVPMVVLPVTNDQPGVGARVEAAGVGRSISSSRLTVARLREAVSGVLADPAYRWRAEEIRSAIAAADGLNRAADVVEAALASQGEQVNVDGMRGVFNGRGTNPWPALSRKRETQPAKIGGS